MSGFIGNNSSGSVGSPGVQGPPGTVLAFAFFYGNAPPNYPATIAVNAALDFPNAGPTSGGSAIIRSGVGQFMLSSAGIYEITWQTSITEPAQLMLRINSVIQPQTVVSRATGTSQISGDVLITTSTSNSILEVINPPGNSTALTITPSDGALTRPPATTLVIKRLL